jgi:hypothetical protein
VALEELNPMKAALEAKNPPQTPETAGVQNPEDVPARAGGGNGDVSGESSESATALAMLLCGRTS